MSQQPTKIVTEIVRFSYCNVWEPQADDKGVEKYNVSILVPKTDAITINRINAAVRAAMDEGKAKLASKNGFVNEATLKYPLRDGDAERPDDPAYVGCYFFNANTKRQPAIVDATGQRIITPSEFYSGCYGRASVTFYAFDFNGKKGIAASLNNIMKTQDGEALAGGSTPEEDFGQFYQLPPNMNDLFS